MWSNWLRKTKLRANFRFLKCFTVIICIFHPRIFLSKAGFWCLTLSLITNGNFPEKKNFMVFSWLSYTIALTEDKNMMDQQNNSMTALAFVNVTFLQMPRLGRFNLKYIFYTKKYTHVTNSFGWYRKSNTNHPKFVLILVWVG